MVEEANAKVNREREMVLRMRKAVEDKAESAVPSFATFKLCWSPPSRATLASPQTVPLVFIDSALQPLSAFDSKKDDVKHVWKSNTLHIS